MVEASRPTDDPARMPQTYTASSGLKRPCWRIAAAITSPNARNTVADGTTKKAIRCSAGTSRARSASARAISSPATPDIAGSSAAETEMPKRLTGSV